MVLGIGERIGGSQEQQLRSQESAASKLRVAIPGIIQEFDPITQTATVQPSIREKVVNASGEHAMMEIPMLLDVPVIFPKAGGFSITFPVAKGDECLVVFADMCIDAWWQSGGVQNQLETRRHDLSDGFAIIGVGSVPKAITNYSMDSVQLRNKENDCHIEITNNKCINIRANKEVNVYAESVTIDSSDIKLGAGAMEGVPLGMTLKSWLDGHTHPTPAGISGSPNSPSPEPSSITKTE
ncbi:Gp138 family membrane-puncturing spike protein [uncultured Tissierella sp.]|uniref:Gp138 family membrane-puncturing spike protein n=1 Tax=uncultured Tissierella sp. TaxID=448160 RepID=UPI0028041D11|nr:Gp138 family membrane-puncturing spike protein [uncultured Tissierella sp.]MDU5080224.1 Gp138 family membrane-puncturing spike protein [Bacillota bacterium]